MTVKILRGLTAFISRLTTSEKPDSSFVFPYATDKTLRRQEVWDNLQKGFLLEDRNILIPWFTPFNQIDKYAETRDDREDRTEWYLGKRTILDGYEGHFEVMKWIWLPWRNPFGRVTAHLGYGVDGYQNFIFLKNHLMNLLGEPALTNIEYENENFTEGSYEWSNGKVKIQIRGFDMHGARYRFDIGLIENKNDDYFKISIKKLRSRLSI